MEVGEEQMEKRMEELKGMEEKQEARVNYYDTKLRTTIAAYFIWQRVFFFGISSQASPSNISTLSCNARWWAILALTCLCSFVYMLLFLDAALMLYREENQLALILRTHARLYRQQADTKHSSMEAGAQSGHGLWLEEELMLINSNSAYRRRNGARGLYLYTILCAFVGVASLELYTSTSVLSAIEPLRGCLGEGM